MKYFHIVFFIICFQYFIFSLIAYINQEIKLLSLLVAILLLLNPTINLYKIFYQKDEN
ncbi:Hypothetical protein KQS_07190 [Flavobacterium indicum GPTSA100-9 = DSM 17447]|uniref:Uncharacterized protein n=1 Tax=Flavobacterium indicum (strain DSM 17447 / CIP 109464 / GPTSA100-9) TaxID=1094466 RepID=H8XQU8_FLAIG|nr:Hypothetical protein KQS_07190 [Flavobacterium indicum GPTSA100-9 = DSM 17447]